MTNPSDLRLRSCTLKVRRSKKSEVAIAQWFSTRQYTRKEQASISIASESTFWRSKYTANSHGKMISQRLAFASRRYARMLAACLPHQGHVVITTDPGQLIRFHNIKFNEMPCKPDSTENLHWFEKYRTVPIPPWSQKLAFSAAIVCMKVEFCCRMHRIEAVFQI